MITSWLNKNGEVGAVFRMTQIEHKPAVNVDERFVGVRLRFRAMRRGARRRVGWRGQYANKAVNH